MFFVYFSVYDNLQSSTNSNHLATPITYEEVVFGFFLTRGIATEFLS